MFTSSLFNSGKVYSGANGGTWVDRLFGVGNVTKAGGKVTPMGAMQQTAVQACVTLLSESIAQLPCELYRRDETGGRKKATDHSLYPVIHSSPNAWMTAFDYYDFCQTSMGMRGNSFDFIEREPNGDISQLIPISQDKIQVLKGPDNLPYYRLLDSGETVPMRMIHHKRWVSENGYTGLSPIELHRNAIGLAAATDEHAEAVFSNGTTLSGVIERPLEAPRLEQETINQLKDAWQRAYAGQNNQFKIAILQEGSKYNQLSMTNEDAQLLASRNYGIIEIARIYKIPPHMIQQLEKSTFNNIEHQGLQYVIYTLMAWIKRHEQAMMRDLLNEDDRKDYYIEFNVSGLLRGDQKSRYEAYALGRQWGWLSVNDIRRLENLAPVDGGNTYLQPMNMVDAAKQGAPTDVTKAQLKQIEEELR